MGTEKARCGRPGIIGQLCQDKSASASSHGVDRTGSVASQNEKHENERLEDASSIEHSQDAEDAPLGG